MTTTTNTPLAAIDTNVLIYAEGGGDDARCAVAQRVVTVLTDKGAVLPVQVAGEAYRVLTRKLKRAPADARQIVDRWLAVFSVSPTTPACLADALDLAVGHRLQVWDAVILASAAEAGCRMLLSEDFQDGFVWRGLTVANPFRTPVHPLLRSLLED